jgi:deazaflavin-dependent oxidoreductase (nitroreductase family)
MPLPRWLAQINKRIFNPIKVRRGARPVLIHTGRSSGKTCRTPLDAHRLPDGYLFIPLYGFIPLHGPHTDWVKNVLAAQAARLWIDGHEIELQSPRLVKKKDIWPMVPTTTKSYPGISSESELLRMDIRRQGSEP